MNDTTTTPHKSILSKLSDLFVNDPRTRDELIELLASAESRGIIDIDVYTIIQGALQVADMQVREIMIPRSQVVAIHSEASYKEIMQKVCDSAHSRFPVINSENTDEVVGILIAKDLLPLFSQGPCDKVNLKEIMRPITVVPESKRLNVLLKEFKANRNHMAIVVNEYGGVAGLVTIEDVLEQIVGDIEDEHDYEDEHLIKQSKKNQFIVKAVTPIEEFNEYFESEFSDKDFDTIGGIIAHEFGHLPTRNESVTINGFTFKVLNADKRSIRLLEVKGSYTDSDKSRLKQMHL